MAVVAVAVVVVVAVVVAVVAVVMISFVLSAMPLIYGLPGISVFIMRSL
jgi:hypothetical protein